MTETLRNLAKAYIATWNEPDPRKRSDQIRTLWSAEAIHYTPTRQCKGYDALQARVEEAHNQFVRDQGYRFDVAGEPLGHHGAVKFHWKMTRPGQDTIDAAGSDVLQLDAAGLIVSDHQFAEPLLKRR